MAPRTAAMAISVVTPEITISLRTLATKRAASGSRASSVGSVMADESETVAVAGGKNERGAGGARGSGPTPHRRPAAGGARLAPPPQARRHPGRGATRGGPAAG